MPNDSPLFMLVTIEDPDDIKQCFGAGAEDLKEFFLPQIGINASRVVLTQDKSIIGDGEFTLASTRDESQ